MASIRIIATPAIAITLAALALALGHALWPKITIDAVTVALLVVAVSPWLGSIFKSFELPGGLKIEYHDLEEVKKKTQDAGLLTPAAGTGGGGPAFAIETLLDRDPNLALAELRLDIEKRLAYLAAAKGLQYSGGTSHLLGTLSSANVISHDEGAALRELISTLNLAVHGAEVDPRAAAWADDVGRRLLRVLDERTEPG